MLDLCVSDQRQRFGSVGPAWRRSRGFGGSVARRVGSSVAGSMRARRCRALTRRRIQPRGGRRRRSPGAQAELAQVACPLCSSRGSVRRRGGWEAQVRAVVYDRYGGPEVLRVADVPMPSPGAGQVRVRVVATSVNLSDWETLRGSPLYARLGGLRSPTRATLGSDIAGWVDATGEGVTRFRPGDEVYGDNLALKGGFADYTVAAASVLTPKPAAGSPPAAPRPTTSSSTSSPTDRCSPTGEHSPPAAGTAASADPCARCSAS